MRTYIVNLMTDASDTFQNIMQFDPDAVIELEDFERSIYFVETEHSIDHLLDAEPGVKSYRVVYGYGVIVGESGYRWEDAHEYVRANGGEIADYRTQCHTEDGDEYFVTTVSSRIEFDTKSEAENFVAGFYNQYFTAEESAASMDNPGYYCNALRIFEYGEWSGRGE